MATVILVEFWPKFRWIFGIEYAFVVVRHFIKREDAINGISLSQVFASICLAFFLCQHETLYYHILMENFDIFFDKTKQECLLLYTLGNRPYAPHQ